MTRISGARIPNGAIPTDTAAAANEMTGDQLSPENHAIKKTKKPKLAKAKAVFCEALRPAGCGLASDRLGVLC